MTRPTSYSKDEADAALCIYEWVMEVIVDGAPNRNDQIVGLIADFGYCAMRNAALQAALISEEVHKIGCAGEDELQFFDVYDWEFIPAFCRALDWSALLDDNQYGSGEWRGNAKAIWATMVAQRALAPGRRAA